MTKARKFYRIGDNLRNGRGLGIVLENKEQLRQPDRKIFSWDSRFPGFSHLPERPRFRQQKKSGALPRDLDMFSSWWLVSDRTKHIFQAIEAQAFDFIECDLILADGTAGPKLWLCDVIQVKDALDEEESDVGVEFWNDGSKHYNLMGAERLVFKPKLVGPARVFRMAHMDSKIFCDDELRDACKAAKLRGVGFRPAIQPYAVSPEKWLAHYRKLADHSPNSPDWSKMPNLWFGMQNLLAEKLMLFFARSGDSDILDEAYLVCKRSVEAFEMPQNLPDFAGRLNALKILGKLLAKYGEDRNDINKIREAVSVSPDLDTFLARYGDLLQPDALHEQAEKACNGSAAATFRSSRYSFKLKSLSEQPRKGFSWNICDR